MTTRAVWARLSGRDKALTARTGRVPPRMRQRLGLAFHGMAQLPGFLDIPLATTVLTACTSGASWRTSTKGPCSLARARAAGSSRRAVVASTSVTRAAVRAERRMPVRARRSWAAARITAAIEPALLPGGEDGEAVQALRGGPGVVQGGVLATIRQQLCGECADGVEQAETVVAGGRDQRPLREDEEQFHAVPVQAGSGDRCRRLQSEGPGEHGQPVEERGRPLRIRTT